ncbi:MAG: type III ribulose-bisphosphate carboxylase [Nanoarchaeota archaeon]|jgi:ribulose-bisphosphate carboxylase large chain|nr:type III ribulose-bisphosphate carboxylase [Nanoarchaeota archaeon]|tara:strand:+ start:8720 stop:9967 length:1248 start_codon:yes stop_codon:yes gene_type:complete
MSQYLDFVDLHYKPSRSDLICKFRFESSKNISIKEAVGRIASESSNGTWTTLSTLKPHIRKIRARAFEIKKPYVKITYPLELFELGNIPQLLSSIAGNIFGMKALKNLRLEDIQFSKKYVSSFKGPQFGIQGIRKLTQVKERPLIATVPKPKVGMTTKEFANVAYRLWTGGVDFVKTDENMTSQPFVNFYKTTREVLKMRDKAEKETGERKFFLANVTAETNEMVKRAHFVKKCGGEFIMVDFLTAGFSGFQTLRNECQKLKLAIHLHRALHGSMTRNPKHGISMLTLAKLARLIGGDTLHIGTVIGKLVGKREDVINLKDSLNRSLYHIKPTLPVSSGGLHPGIIPYILKMLGKDIMVQSGGGVLGNPLGVEAGAKALRQSIEATLQKVTLKIYSQKHKELSAALKKWGTSQPV